MQVFGVESLYCCENATKKVSFRRLVCNTHLLACSFLSVKRNKHLSSSMYLFGSPIYWLVPFCASKGTSYSLIICSFHLTTSLLACSFSCLKRNKSHQSLHLFYTPTITIKAQPLWIVPPICATRLTFSNCTK